jgi:hypothetical protein
VQEYFALPYHEDRDREMPARLLRTHKVAGYIRAGYMGSQPSSTEVHRVRSIRERTEGGG